MHIVSREKFNTTRVPFTKMVNLGIFAVAVGMMGVVSALQADWMAQRCLKAIANETNSTIAKSEYCTCICREARHPPIGPPPADVEAEVPSNLSPDVPRYVALQSGRDLFRQTCGRLCPAPDHSSTEADDTVPISKDASELDLTDFPPKGISKIDERVVEAKTTTTERLAMNNDISKSRQKRSLYGGGFAYPHLGGGGNQNYGGGYGYPNYGGGFYDYYNGPYDPYYNPYYY